MPQSSSNEQLQTILDEGDNAACQKFFAKATEAERRTVAPIALASFKKVSDQSYIQIAENKYALNPLWNAASTAVLSACTVSELKRLGWGVLHDVKASIAVAEDRPAAWRQALCDWLTETNRAWPLVRHLVRQKLCSRPEHPNYILGMIRAMDGFFTDESIGPRFGSLLKNLRRDSDLLQSEVCKVFHLEGNGYLTLAAHDKYLGNKSDDYRWDLALKELSRKGELSRERLLDESLEALNRGFSQFRVAWFSQFHELLEPTIEERLARQE